MFRLSSYCKGLSKSFANAFWGLFYTIRTQHNFQIHLISSIAVIITGIFFEISKLEWLIIALTIFIVFIAETFNTAIEKLVDFVSPEYDKIAGLVKDIAAGAVLLTAIMSVIIGLIIFLPYIFLMF